MNKISNGCTGKISQPHIEQNQSALAKPKNKKNVFIERINRLFNTKLFNALLKHPKKTKNTEIIPSHQGFVKLAIPEVVPLKTLKNTNLAPNNVHIEPIIAKTIPSEIDQFTEKLHHLNIIFKNDAFGADHRPTFLVKNYSANRTVTLNRHNYLGKGEYGIAYRMGNFVIKIPHRDLIFKYNKYAEYGRCARVLNEINQDVNFSRSTTLANGNVVLVTKFIDGKSIKGKEAFDFVKSRGRMIMDYGSDGNVKKDNKNNTYLIDADFAAQPKQLNRTLSIGTTEIYKRYRK
ncbi:hypothetical protein LDO51_06185 [Providencia alcalifaciens]|uniref:hypothetical protein n=1 Tax=Providencia alcalifaciens TaxID=126385 RepID=UPI001CE1DE00|nr:hypothetical protein [Providencia alcalifaciens]UBX50374.1 hypothetical protein LDO51_06185 [Providencia alcalifaciens]